jgi:hypothetical protein
MTEKKIARRKFFGLLPGCVVAACTAAINPISVPQEKPDIDYDRLAEAVLDTPLEKNTAIPWLGVDVSSSSDLSIVSSWPLPDPALEDGGFAEFQKEILQRTVSEEDQKMMNASPQV